MTETRVFTKEGIIEVLVKEFSVVSEFDIISKRIIPNTKFDIDTNCSIKNIYGDDYVNIKFDNSLSGFCFIEKDIIQKISREFIKPYIMLKHFSIKEANEFLKEHSELNFENAKIMPNGTGVLLAYEVEGDKNINYLG